MPVRFYTTERLANKFCNGECIHRVNCAPQTMDDQTNDSSGLNILVKGGIVASECPILSRVFPFAGWLDAVNHGGKCGEQQE